MDFGAINGRPVFEKALKPILDFQKSCFYYDLWHCRRPLHYFSEAGFWYWDTFAVHHFMRIKSRCSDAETWLDDGFFNKKIVHKTPPSPYGDPMIGGGGEEPNDPGVIPQPPGGVDW